MNVGGILHILRFADLQHIADEKFVKEWVTHFSHLAIEDAEVVLFASLPNGPVYRRSAPHVSS